MKVGGKHYHTIWQDPDDPKCLHSIDQRKLPFDFVIEHFTRVDEVAVAIRDMHLRGAPLIGVAAAFGMYLAGLEHQQSDGFQQHLEKAAETLLQTRPTAVNLRMAVQRQMEGIRGLDIPEYIVDQLLIEARKLLDEELENCRQIGMHGVELIEEIGRRKGNKPVNILTHCNAGWLACIDYGTATAPIYFAHDKGLNVHVWVDETRPRNQGSRLTAWELLQHGVPHTLIADNTGGHLMQHGKVDLVIVGSDRTSRTGDVANKIGTYLKALAAHDNDIPFYVALPSTSIDWDIHDGLSQIPIEERSGEEVHFIEGMEDEALRKVRISPERTKAVNYGFDITPARLVTGLITERGISAATEEGLKKLFPNERRSK